MQGTVRGADVLPAFFGGHPTSNSDAEPNAINPDITEIEDALGAKLGGYQAYAVGGLRANHYLAGMIVLMIAVGAIQQARS